MRILIILLMLTLLASCTIEKRLYRPGYRIESVLFERESKYSQNEDIPQKLKSKTTVALKLETRALSAPLKVKPNLLTIPTSCEWTGRRNQ